MTPERDASPEDEREPWIAFRVESMNDRNEVMAALFEAGSQGVHEEGSALVTHFPPGHDVARIKAAILARDPRAVITVSNAPAMDWSEWRASVRAHSIGALTIVPPWLREEGNPAQVVIEPAMAFGTGEHATTRGVVRLMQRLPAMPSVVADLGAGSAVLSICAAKLGAKKVIAIEVDHDAIGNAEENVRVNGVEDVVHVLEGDAAVLLPLVAPVQLVLANIISSVLLEMLPLIHRSLAHRGSAILSGILVEEKERMLTALADDWSVSSTDSEEGWWSVLIERRQ